MRVLYTMLLERSLPEAVVLNWGWIIAHSAQRGHVLFQAGYARTDYKRHTLCKTFLENTTEDDDVLVMLDNDLIHPVDIVSQLTKYNPGYPVVGSLAVQRNGDKILAFSDVRPEDGHVDFVLKDELCVNEDGLMPVWMVTPNAMAIRRHALTKLLDAGEKCFFAYSVKPGTDMNWWGEDMYFGEICQKHEVGHWLAPTIQSKHIEMKLKTLDDAV